MVMFILYKFPYPLFTKCKMKKRGGTQQVLCIGIFILTPRKEHMCSCLSLEPGSG